MKKKVFIIIGSVIVLFIVSILGLYLCAVKSTIKGSCIYIDENNTVQYINLKDKTCHKICPSDFIYNGESYCFESFSQTGECDFYGVASNNSKKIIVYFNAGKYFAAEYDDTVNQDNLTRNGNMAYIENGLLYIKNSYSESQKIAEATGIYGWVSEYLIFKNGKTYYTYCDGQTKKLSDKILLIVGDSSENVAVICRRKSLFGVETNYSTCFCNLKYRAIISYPFEVFFPLGLEPAKVYWSSSNDFKEYENINLEF